MDASLEPQIQKWWDPFQNCDPGTVVGECMMPAEHDADVVLEPVYEDGSPSTWRVDDTARTNTNGRHLASGTPDHGDSSGWTFRFAIPTATPGSREYSLSFDYRVSSEEGHCGRPELHPLQDKRGDCLEVVMTRNVAGAGDPLSGTCFTASGDAQGEYNAATAAARSPTNATDTLCHAIPPGTHEISFHYTKDNSGSGGPNLVDFAAIDNLEINTLPH